MLRRLAPPGAVILLVIAAVAGLPGAAAGDQASQPGSPAAGHIATGSWHSCAVVLAGALRCWGYGGDGQLGYGDARSIGDDDTPSSAGPVDLGPGRTVKAVSAGTVHTCAQLDDDSVRCWGYNGDGRLGYMVISDVGLTDEPADHGPVDLGTGRSAKAISAGAGHTCALLDDDTVRCWGFGFDGRLGYNSRETIGNNETPGTAGPVDFGPGRTAKAITAGGAHTCAILDDDTVRCWGFGSSGRLGYPGVDYVGRGCVMEGTECVVTPDAPSVANVGPVDLGAGRTAKAISAGAAHTCAVLDDNTVRCWGAGGNGRLGYGNSTIIGDNETPGTVGPVDLGAGRTAVAIDAGGRHTCAVLDDGNVRCWGYGAFGQLGYANALAVGNSQTPGAVGPVELGEGRTATAISTGDEHTCALLDDDSVRCWGYGRTGLLGLCSEAWIGDDETPASVGTIALGVPGIPGTSCPVAPPPPPPPAGATPQPVSAVVTPPPAAGSPAADALATALAAQRARAAALRSCQRRVTRRLAGDRRTARALPAARRRGALRLAVRRADGARRACVRRHGRVPGRVSRLGARATGRGKVQLSFRVAGTDGARAPAARRYVVKQSGRAIRSSRDFARAPALCNGRCSFAVTSVGATVTLTITNLRRNRTYHYAVAALDNVSGRRGPRSRSIAVRAG